MRNAILCVMLLAVFRVVCAQAPDNRDNPAACHAAFTANPEPGNPMFFHFQDQSSGQIKHWQWSFGDGVTSTLQNPSHTYSAGGTYFVCLTVSDSDSGYLCHDMLCVPVTVHEPGACVADFIYTIDIFDHLKTEFTDKSSGNINSWHWDFGDGTVSAERNPHHIFPDYGKYKVCLMAYNADSISVCNDVKCDSINIVLVEQCHALFTSELDSMNHEPNTFKFIDSSTGDPNHYLWSFDDGTFYSTRNVTHQFHVDGDHKVCLRIIKEGVTGTICSDSLCKTVNTAKYYNLGGHLFVGEFPINNPVSTGDTGLAYLYRKDGSRLIPYDTTLFTHLGYYTFPKILNGLYVVQTTLTPGSAHYSSYFPTYYPQAMKWQEAPFLNLSDSSSYAVNTHLLPIYEAPSGTGIIKGKVVAAGLSGNSSEISYAEVILYNAQLNPLHYTLSEKSGKFELNNLQYGAYYLYVESPGRYSRLTAVWLDSTNPVADSIRLEVFDYDVTGISDDVN
ncbi:MAG: PKD domain-containing protein, partial [Bacteroidia bacterium]|nr:PKD domain-containing protein [Bacteroidia bacterium]